MREEAGRREGARGRFEVEVERCRPFVFVPLASSLSLSLLLFSSLLCSLLSRLGEKWNGTKTFAFLFSFFMQKKKKSCSLHTLSKERESCPSLPSCASPVPLLQDGTPPLASPPEQLDHQQEQEHQQQRQGERRRRRRRGSCSGAPPRCLLVRCCAAPQAQACRRRCSEPSAPAEEGKEGKREERRR